MGLFQDIIGTFTGSTGAHAASQAAGAQTQAIQQAIDQLRGDIAPVTGTLGTSIPLLMQAAQNPQDILQNPLLHGLFQDVTNRTLAAQAAGGRAGAGDTGTSLLNSLIPIGLNYQNQRFNQLFNLANLGSTAAQQTGTSIADLLTQAGNARAAGITGAANARSQGVGNLIGVGAGAGLGAAGLLGKNVGAGGGALLGLLSDETMKTDIKKLDEVNGIGIYSYKYIDDPETYIGVMAQEVEKVYPEVINEHDGIKFVNYDKLNEFVKWQ